MGICALSPDPGAPLPAGCLYDGTAVLEGEGPEGNSQVHPGGCLEEVAFCIDGD